MAFTYQSACDLARLSLNDADKSRYPDAGLLSYANHAALQIFSQRPDLFIGGYSVLPTGEAALSDALPVPARYMQAVASYIVAMAESADDEHVNSGRAAAFMKLFNAEIQS